MHQNVEEEDEEEEEEEEEDEEENDTHDPEEDKNYAVIPPNGGWGWMVVACAFYCNVVVDGIQLTFGVFLKDISESFQVDYAKVALAGSLMFGVHLLMGPLCAGFSSVFGLRPVTITGSLICCFGVGLAYFATGYWYLYITYGVVGGMGLGLIYMNSLVITGLYFTTLMPIAIGIVVCGTGVGTMVFAGLGHFLLRVATWQTTFLVEAALAGSMGIAAIAFKPLKPVRVELSGSTTLAATSSMRAASSKPTTKKGVVFIKKEVPNRSSGTSIRTFQSLIWDGYLEDAVVKDFKRKQLCLCGCEKCCRCLSRKTKAKKSSVLLLSEFRNNNRHTRRKSYVEKGNAREGDLDSMHEYEEDSNAAHQTIFARVDFDKKEKIKPCEPLKRTVIAMMDCHLLRSCAFFLFTVSGALQMAALLIVYIYEKDRCKELGYSDEMSVYFVVSLGGANTFWRLFLGGIATIPKVNYQALAISGIVIGGVATMCSGLSDNIYYQFGYCVLFGLGMASFAVFRLILLLDIVDVTMVENATGINLLFMGITCIVFPPFFGWLMELTHSYNVIFLTTGFLVSVSGLMLAGLKKLREKELKRAEL